VVRDAADDGAYVGGPGGAELCGNGEGNLIGKLFGGAAGAFESPMMCGVTTMYRLVCVFDVVTCLKRAPMIGMSPMNGNLLKF